MRTSEATDKIDAALAKAQAEMENPTFDSVNPHFKSRYASLAAVRNAIIPVLAKHGIACVQELTQEEGKIGCATRLSHAGQWIEFAPFFLPPSKVDAQGYGSASTYARRYSLQAVAGVSGDEDDDGNVAATPVRRKATVNPVTPTAGAMDRVSPDRVDVINEYVTRLRDAFIAEDGLACAELASELHDSDEKVAVWSQLDSAARSFIKRAVDAAKSPPKWTPTPEEAAAIAAKEAAEAS
jgi:hypothetical protein